MFSEQANALQESLQTLSNASIEFIKANRSNDRKEMMKSSTAGMNSLLSTAQIILAYRDGATLAKDRKFTQDSVGLIYESGITENLKQLVLRDYDTALISLVSSVPSFNDLLNKIKHGEF